MLCARGRSEGHPWHQSTVLPSELPTSLLVLVSWLCQKLGQVCSPLSAQGPLPAVFADGPF